MKHFISTSKILVLAVLLTGLFGFVNAQVPDAVTKDISNAIRTGNADALAKHFNSQVEVTLPPDVDESFSPQQATQVFKDFFASYKVSGFSEIHKGSSGATFYNTGHLNTSKGEFDTNVFLKKVGDSFKITQIRFEAD